MTYETEFNRDSKAAVTNLEEQLNTLKRLVKKKLAAYDKVNTLGKADYGYLGDLNKIASDIAEINRYLDNNSIG